MDRTVVRYKTQQINLLYMNKNTNSTKHPIDVVITWVNGDDKEHKAKRKAYTTDQNETSREDIGGETRFRSVGEIAYCVASINKFAPYVRKIFIVTDDQNPMIEEFINSQYPNAIPMEIVSHKTLFRGYEEYLPVFNSLAIETMLWRIPDLSEHYVYMNDDVMLVTPTTEETFFQDGKAVTYGYWHWTFTARLTRLLRKKRNGHKMFTFKDSMLNAVVKSGPGLRFHRIRHIAHAMRKSVFQEYFDKKPDDILANIQHRFRHADQYNPQALFYNVAIRKKKAISRPIGETELYMKGADRGVSDYVDNKLKLFDERSGAVFCCLNSLDLMSVEERYKVVTWLKERIGLNEYFINIEKE